MKNISALAVAFFAIVALTLVGCGSPFSIAPVSGKVTSNGEPIAGLLIIFTPMPNEANTDPGPWSTGVTNAQGEYTLKTRHKDPGAAIGKHLVGFEYEEGGAEDLDDLEEDLDSAIEEGEPAATVASLKKQIADLKAKAKTRPQIAEDFTLEFEVPAGGTTEADFDFE